MLHFIMLYECYVILCYGILTFHFNIQICIDTLPVGFASFLVFIYWFSQAFGKSRQLISTFNFDLVQLETISSNHSWDFVCKPFCNDNRRFLRFLIY